MRARSRAAVVTHARTDGGASDAVEVASRSSQGLSDPETSAKGSHHDDYDKKNMMVRRVDKKVSIPNEMSGQRGPWKKCEESIERLSCFVPALSVEFRMDQPNLLSERRETSSIHDQVRPPCEGNAPLRLLCPKQFAVSSRACFAPLL